MLQISIIVPIYNAEKYLPRCIDSILAQTFTDFELLLIDDGSTDGSGAICEEYAAKDARIRVFHKKNGGVSSARNLGLDEANGFYSIHVDSDDWIEPNMLGEMWRKCKSLNCDVLIADYFDGNTHVMQRPLSNDAEIVLRSILLGKLHGGLWNKMLRHGLYKEYGVRFNEAVGYCEDVLVFAHLLQHAIKVEYVDKAFYHYTSDNEISITRRYNLDKYVMRKKFVLSLIKILPCSYKRYIEQTALRVKSEAFANGLFMKEEFYSFFPSPVTSILKLPENRFLRFCLLLAKCGFYKQAFWLYHRNKRC